MSDPHVLIRRVYILNFRPHLWICGAQSLVSRAHVLDRRVYI